jgi:hypothetical protein
MKYLGLILILFLFSCRKNKNVVDSTEFKLSIERDFFEDSLYKITAFNLISTNDSIIQDARVRVMDDSSKVVLLEEDWRNLRQSTFDLPLRKNYKLKLFTYRVIEGMDI